MGFSSSSSAQSSSWRPVSLSLSASSGVADDAAFSKDRAALLRSVLGSSIICQRNANRTVPPQIPAPAPGQGSCLHCVAVCKMFALPGIALKKRRVFERVCRTGKVTGKSGLNLSQNTSLISASQKVRVRLSVERVHEDQTDKGRSSALARCLRLHASKIAVPFGFQGIWFADSGRGCQKSNKPI